MASTQGQSKEKGLTLKATRVAGSSDCLNCGTELKGPFCYYCGQPDKRFLRFFPVMIREMLQDLLELDSRFTRTIIPLLFHPGLLTRDYIDGRRFRYTPPIRIYLFASVIFFLLATLAAGLMNWDEAIKINGDDAAVITLESGEILDLTDPEVLLRLENGELSRDDLKVVTDPEAVKKLRGDQPEDDEVHIQIGDEPWHRQDNPFLVPFFPERLNDWLNDEIEKTPQKAKALSENPKLIFEIAMNVLPQVVFILLPVFALIMKFWYLFAKRFYIEHLIFSLHNHSFLFVIFLILLVLKWLESGMGMLGWTSSGSQVSFTVVQTAVLAWIPIYMLLAMKRVYQQGWILTLVKYFAVGMTYMLILTFALVMAGLIGFLTF